LALNRAGNQKQTNICPRPRQFAFAIFQQIYLINSNIEKANGFHSAEDENSFGSRLTLFGAVCGLVSVATDVIGSRWIS